MTRVQAWKPRNGLTVWFTAGTGNSSPLQNVQTGSERHSPPRPWGQEFFPRGQSRRSVKVTSHLYLLHWSRMPVEARFSAPVHTCPEVHPASYTVIAVLFQEVQRPGSGVNQLSQSSPEVKERVGLYLYSPSVLSWPVLEWTVEWNTGRLTNGEQAVVVILRKAIFLLPDKPLEKTFVFKATASPACRYIMLVCFYSMIIYGSATCATLLQLNWQSALTVVCGWRYLLLSLLSKKVNGW